jgi:hypothetical protein
MEGESTTMVVVLMNEAQSLDSVDVPQHTHKKSYLVDLLSFYEKCNVGRHGQHLRKVILKGDFEIYFEKYILKSKFEISRRKSSRMIRIFCDENVLSEGRTTIFLARGHFLTHDCQMPKIAKEDPRRRRMNESIP